MQTRADRAAETVIMRPPTGPEAILSADWLLADEKRAVLASWASDIHAVRDKPALRELEDGTVLEVDTILDALKALDHSV